MATKPRANMEKLITEPTNEQVIVPTVEQRSESELQKEDGGKKSSGRTQKNEETRTPSQTNERQTRTHKLKSCTPQPLSKPCTQDDMPVDPALPPNDAPMENGVMSAAEQKVDNFVNGGMAAARVAAALARRWILRGGKVAISG